MTSRQPLVPTPAEALTIMETWIARHRALSPSTLRTRPRRAEAVLRIGTKPTSKGSAYAAVAALQTTAAAPYVRALNKVGGGIRDAAKDPTVASQIHKEVARSLTIQRALLSGPFRRRIPLRRKAAKLPEDAFLRIIVMSEKQEAKMRSKGHHARANLELERRRGFLAQVLTGARPAELVKTISLDIAGPTVAAVIKGAKCKHKGRLSHGQPTRGVGVVITNETMVGVIARNFGDGMHQVGTSEKSTAICEWLARRGKQAGVGRTSAYDARNKFAANLKACPLTKKEIAIAMGHAATGTAAYYSHRSRSPGGLKVKHALGDRAVRETHRVRDVSHARKASSKPVGGGSKPVRNKGTSNLPHRLPRVRR